MGLMEMTLISLVSIATTLVSEFLSWYLVFRHEDFQDLQRKLTRVKAQRKSVLQIGSLCGC